MKLFLFILTLFLFFNCSSIKNSNQSEDNIDPGDCRELLKNNFSNITNQQIINLVDRDTVIVNEIRFECVQSITYTSKVLFDNYRKWDVVLKTPESKHPTLMWKNLDLLKNGKRYQVLTKGRFGDIRFASVIVLDSEGNDVLANKTLEKVKIVNLFSNLIKANQNENREFFIHYWNAVDSNKWKL